MVPFWGLFLKGFRRHIAGTLLFSCLIDPIGQTAPLVLSFPGDVVGAHVLDVPLGSSLLRRLLLDH